MKLLSKPLFFTALLGATAGLASAQVVSYDKTTNYVSADTTLGGGALAGSTGSADLDGSAPDDSISVIAFGTQQ